MFSCCLKAVFPQFPCQIQRQNLLVYRLSRITFLQQLVRQNDSYINIFNMPKLINTIAARCWDILWKLQYFLKRKGHQKNLTWPIYSKFKNNHILSLKWSLKWTIWPSYSWLSHLRLQIRNFTGSPQVFGYFI